MLSARVQVSAAAGSNRSASLACRAVPCPRPALHCRPCTCHPSPQVHRATVVCSASKPAPKGFGAQTAVVKEPAIKDGQACPCGAGKTYAECCQPLHSGAAAAAGPEQLLRARYSAYYGKVIDYVVDTTHPESPEYQGSKSTYTSAVKQTARRMQCKALEIQKQEPGRTPDEAYITFKLSYVKTDNKGKPDQQGSKAPPAASSSSPLSSLANMFGGGGGKKAAPAEEVTERVEKSRFIRDKKGRWYFIDSAFEGEEEAKKEGVTV